MTPGPIAWRWSAVDATTTSSETHLTHRTAAAELIVRKGRLIGGSGYAAASVQTRRQLSRVGAIVRLREKGRYLIHAAGVVDPTGQGWLLTGNSGAGKSTLAYALARAGWQLLGDDGVLIEVGETGVTAYPWKDALHVSSALAAEFPELLDHAARAMTRDARRRIPMNVAFASATPLSALIFVERAAQHTVSPLSPLEALASLIRQSPWVMIDDAHSRTHLEALRRTTALPCFRLRHTPLELHTIARILGELRVA